MKKIALLDTYAFFYKAHYAFEKNPLFSQKGENTSVIFSFISSLIQIVSENDLENLICVLDSKGKTIRHEIESTYKANRPPIPEDLKLQINALVDFIPLLGIPCLQKSGYEADDIIAQLVRESKKKNDVEILIFSSDKDLMQLVGENTYVMLGDRQNRHYIKMNDDKVKEKYGVIPQKIADYLALVGDSSDNVAGVRGVGKVSASKLLQTYKNVEDIYENIEQIKGSLQEKLKQGRDSAFLSKKLVTLDHSLDGIAGLKDLSIQPMQEEKVKEILTHYECHALLKKILNHPFFLGNSPLDNKKKTTQQQEESINPFDFHRKDVKNTKEIEEMIHFLRENKHFIFDLETTSLDVFTAQIITISFAVVDKKKDRKTSFFLHLSANNLDFANLTDLHKLFSDETIKKIGHNLKYEYSVLKNHRVCLRGISHDTMIYEYLSNAGFNRLKLEDLSIAYLDYHPVSYRELTNKQEDITQLDYQKLREYSLQDSEITALIHSQQTQWANADIFKKIEIPLISVLAEIELNGVCIDTAYLKQLQIDYEKKLAETEKEIYLLAGEEFNIHSTKQLKEILFEKKGLTPWKKNKTGYSTDQSVLEKLSKEHPIASSLLTYRKYDKLLSTYVKTLPTLVHPQTHKIHTSYNQAITATGRLSSNKPNLQNIPVKSENGRGLRHAFIAPAGMDFVSIDYSQVELRVLAYLSKDKVLNQAYREKLDIHKKTASLLFEKDESDIDNRERNIAKIVNFSIIYGTSAHSLANVLSLSYDEAKKFIFAYKKSYPDVIQYMQEKIEEARKNLYVSTYFGRKRFVKSLTSENFQLRSRDERIAFNTIIQGTASDIIKIAMIKINQSIDEQQLPCKMVMQVHDELIFYIPTQQTNIIIPELIKKMTNIEPFAEILEAQAIVGKCWSK